MSTPLPTPPDDDFSESIFESNPPEPSPPPTPPASNLESAQAGLSPEAREEILQIARRAGLQDDDPLVALIAAVRRGDRELAELCRKVLDAVDRAPQKMEDAAAGLKLQRKEIAEDKSEQKNMLKKQGESQQYTEKMSRCILTLGIGCLIILCACMGLLTAGWVALEKAANFTEVAKSFESSSESVRKLQHLTHSRLLLQAQENGLQSEWRKLQIDVEKAGGQTEEHKKTYARLKDWKEEIDARWAKQREAEKEVLGK